MERDYINRILDGDIRLFSYFVKKYKDLAYAVAFQIIRNPQDAEEVVQDAFMKAYTHLSRFEGKARFSTWLYRIVYNTAVTRKSMVMKQLAKVEELPDGVDFKDDVADTLQLVKKEERSKYVHQALRMLREEESLLLTLFYLNENSIEEIADIVNINNNNIKVKLHRARKNLLVILEQLLKEELPSLI